MFRKSFNHHVMFGLAEHKDAVKPSLGFCGKIPGQGDFVSRNLSVNFLKMWNVWLEECICYAKQSLADRWIDYYTTSPVWRFLLSKEVIDSTAWVGVVFPSVDAVGRYYPLTLAYPLAEGTYGLDWMNQAHLWFSQLEDLAAKSLENRWGLVEFEEGLLMLEASAALLEPVGRSEFSPNLLPFATELGEADQLPSTHYALALSRLIKTQYDNYSLWWSKGTGVDETALMVAQGMPSAQQAIAFLNGDLSAWG